MNSRDKPSIPAKGISRTCCRQCRAPLIPGKFYPTKCITSTLDGFKSAVGGYCEHCHEQFLYNPAAQLNQWKERVTVPITNDCHYDLLIEDGGVKL